MKAKKGSSILGRLLDCLDLSADLPDKFSCYIRCVFTHAPQWSNLQNQNEPPSRLHHVPTILGQVDSAEQGEACQIPMFFESWTGKWKAGVRFVHLLRSSRWKRSGKVHVHSYIVNDYKMSKLRPDPDTYKSIPLCAYRKQVKQLFEPGTRSTRADL